MQLFLICIEFFEKLVWFTSRLCWVAAFFVFLGGFNAYVEEVPGSEDVLILSGAIFAVGIVWGFVTIATNRILAYIEE